MKKIKLYGSGTQKKQVTHSEGLIEDSVMKELFTEAEAGLRELTLDDDVPMSYQYPLGLCHGLHVRVSPKCIC